MNAEFSMTGQQLSTLASLLKEAHVGSFIILGEARYQSAVPALLIQIDWNIFLVTKDGRVGPGKFQLPPPKS
jgi:hypothetical protein